MPAAPKPRIRLTQVKRWMIRYRRISVASAAIVLVVLAFAVFRHVSASAALNQESRKEAELQANTAISAIEQELSSVMEAAEHLASGLSNGAPSQHTLIEQATQVLHSLDRVYGVAIAFEPFKLDPEVKLVAPLVRRLGAEIDISDIAHDGDYTTTAWYRDSLAGAGWISPTYSKTKNQLIAIYGAPFYLSADHAGPPDGVVTLSYTLEEIRRIVDDLTPGETGYGMILDRRGTFIVHPVVAFVREQRDIRQIADARELPALREIGERILRGESGSLNYINEVSEQASTIYFRGIPRTTWTMGVVFIRDQGADLSAERTYLVRLALLATVFSFLALNVWFAYRALGWTDVLRASSTSATVLLLLCIGFIWAVVKIYPESPANENRIFHHSSLERVIDEHRQQTAAGLHEDPVFIPTGIFLQSLEFTSSYNVSLTGYVWQKYNAEQLAHLNEGVIFPESISEEFEETYREKNTDDITTIGWYFETTLRQNFVFDKYPFDQKDVWIRLWHKDFYRNTVLTPDLRGYELLHPSAHPGIERDFVLAGWSVEQSFFNYQDMSYNVNFGLDDYYGQADFPELFFNVVLTRNFIDAFIAEMIPLFVVASILFAVLLTFTRRTRKLELFGFNATEVLAAAASLFFTVLLAHIQLRGKLEGVEGIIYIEYVYFLMYIMILLVTANSYFFSQPGGPAFVKYKDNLIPRLLYWPVLLLLFLAVTLTVL